jgi:hypothetical protein
MFRKIVFYDALTRDLAAQLALSLSLITPNKLIDCTDQFIEPTRQKKKKRVAEGIRIREAALAATSQGI